MKFQRYLNEKYYDAVKSNYSGEFAEIFINPSTKELKEIGSIRGIADTKTKKFYAWGAWGINHHNMVNGLPKLKKELGLNDFAEYWKQGKGLDHIFAFDSMSYTLDSLNSDSIDYLARDVGTQKILDDMNKLYDADWSFMKKYTNTNLIQRVIADAIKTLEKKLG